MPRCRFVSGPGCAALAWISDSCGGAAAILAAATKDADIGDDEFPDARPGWTVLPTQSMLNDMVASISGLNVARCRFVVLPSCAALTSLRKCYAGFVLELDVASWDSLSAGRLTVLWPAVVDALLA